MRIRNWGVGWYVTALTAALVSVSCGQSGGGSHDSTASSNQSLESQPALTTARLRPPAELKLDPSPQATLRFALPQAAPQVPIPGNIRAGVIGEIQVAASANGKDIVVVDNNINITTSTDYGQTFTPATYIPIFAQQGDPSISVGASGNFYFAHVAYPQGLSPNRTCGNALAVSTNEGRTFTTRSVIVASPTSGVNVFFPDQPQMVADRFNPAPGGGDQIYSVWRNFTTASPAADDTCDPKSANATRINQTTPFIVCSQDSGTTWGNSQRVDITNGGTDFGRPTVGADGSVYVAYRRSNDLLMNKFTSCANGLAQVAGFPVTVLAGVPPVDCATGIPGPDRCPGVGHQVAADDTNAQHVLLTYATKTGAGNEDVNVIDSLDGGANWRTSVRVNAAVQGRRYFPWICVSQGSAFVSWYDQRAGVTGPRIDLTDYFGGSVFLDPSQKLVAGNDLRISTASDPQCLSGFVGTDTANDVILCPENYPGSGRCRNNPNTTADTFTPCDLRTCALGTGCECAGAETCQATDGRPKYGDYNGNACAAGRFYTAWESAALPTPVTPAGLGVYFRCPQDPKIVNADFNDTTPPVFDSVPGPVNLTTCSSLSLAQPAAHDVCGTAPVTFTNNAPAKFGRGDTSVTWTAKDAAGNTAPATEHVIVNDTTPPTIQPPPNVDVPVCNGGGSITVGLPNVADDCVTPTPTGQVISLNGVAINPPLNVLNGQVVLGFGTYVIRWTASDGINTSAPVFQTVTVGSKIQAAGNFIVDDNAFIEDTNGGGGQILNSGNGQTHLGVASTSGSIISVAPVTLLDRAKVTGNIVSHGGITVPPTASVSGTRTLNANVVLPPLPPLPAFPPPTGGNITVNNGVQPLTPGSYGTVTLNSGATLIMSAGDFFFQSFLINSSVNVKVQVSPNTRVFVQNQFAFRSPFVNAGGTLQPILVGFAGANLTVETTFNGTLLAPNASVIFGIGSGINYRGSFYAKNIEVRNNSALVCDEGPTPPLPTNPAPSSCSDGQKDGNETDADCGGPVCQACVNGRVCTVNGDCQSGSCNGGICQQPSGQFTASVSVFTDWGTGYCANVVFKNLSAQPTTNWSVSLNSGQSTTYTTWNGNFSAATGLIVVTPGFSWNKAVPAGATNQTVGFCANRTPANSGALPVFVSASAAF
jgi:Cellulose binding domain/HYR domain